MRFFYPNPEESLMGKHAYPKPRPKPKPKPKGKPKLPRARQLRNDNYLVQTSRRLDGAARDEKQKTQANGHIKDCHLFCKEAATRMAIQVYAISASIFPNINWGRWKRKSVPNGTSTLLWR